jgi:transmembrane sensor
MNRYSRRPIVILDAQAGQLRISGAYSVRNAEAFASSVSEALPIDVEFEPDRITLRAALR